MKNGREQINNLSGRDSTRGKNSAKRKNSKGGKITPKMRVTGGNLRGREFLSPQAAGTHPMGAREKIALFNMLAGELTGARVLDAYAGSGALGIEALSRGAREVVFVEKNTGVARVLKENLRKLGLENTELEVKGVREFVENSTEKNTKRTERIREQNGEKIVNGEVSGGKSTGKNVAKSTEQKFDIILADPPYDKFDITEVELLTKLLKHGSIMVLSHPEAKSEATEVADEATGATPDLTEARATSSGAKAITGKKMAKSTTDAPILTGTKLIKSKKYAGARISVYRYPEAVNRDEE